jgi:hypothetical protein
LGVCAVLAAVGWNAQLVTRVLSPGNIPLSNAYTGYLSGSAISVACGIAGILAAALAVLLARRLRRGAETGAVVLGWSALTACGFIAYLTEGWRFRGVTEADNVIVVLLLAVTAALAASSFRRPVTA